MKILIAEDDKASQRIVINLLVKSCGIPLEDITIANNGKEAVDLVRAAKIPYDFIYMDHQMPIMYGDVATREIREWEDAQQSPHRSFVLCCSGTFVGPFARADSAIPKPITSPENSSAFVALIRRIKEETRLLQIRRSSAALEPLSESPVLEEMQEDGEEDGDDIALLRVKRHLPIRREGDAAPRVVAMRADGGGGGGSPLPCTLLADAEACALRTGSPLPLAAGIAITRTTPPPGTMTALRKVGMFGGTPLSHGSPQGSPRCSPTISSVTLMPTILGK